MKKILLLILLFAGLCGFKQGNSRRISGTVYAKDDGTPLPGVTVKVEGTYITTNTNASGEFTTALPNGSERLLFSDVGYKSKSVRVGNNDKLSIYLERAINSLNETVLSPNNNPTQRDISESVAAAINGTTGPQTDVKTKKGMPDFTTYSAPFLTRRSPVATSNRRAASNTESYERIFENGFNDAKSSPLSTFSVDVDAASYSNVRRFINNGQLPPADAVRIEEMINYFHYNLPGPTNGDPVAIHTELSSAPWNAKHNLLRIGLKAKTIDAGKLPPSNLVFLIDVSGSMNMANKLPLVKASMKLLTEQLRAQDRVAIVTYAGHAGVVLASTSGDKKKTIINAIERLSAHGSTAGGEGIKMAYRIAGENFMANGNNRIIMATDGDFNVGPSSDGDMEQLIVRERNSNVAISIMGFGMGNLKDSKMETLADEGNGNYAYIDNLSEARKALVTEFAGTLFTVAKDVKLQIEFNPAKVKAYRLLGYEDRMLNKEDFNNDKKDAGDIGSGHTVTALYEIVPVGTKDDDYAGDVDPLKYQKTEPVLTRSRSNEMVTIKFRYKQNGSPASKMSLVTVGTTPTKLNASSDDFRFAATVAEFGMLLRDSQFKQQSTFNQVISLAKEAIGQDKEGYRAEFVHLVEKAKMHGKNVLASK